MDYPISLKVNGIPYDVRVDAVTSLLSLLRDQLDLTGTKDGCHEGECGACTVIMSGKPVNACLVLAVEANGSEILTVEGLSQGEELHPLQQAFVDCGAIQCGFCTPGMLMSAKALLDENPGPTSEEIRKALRGIFAAAPAIRRLKRLFNRLQGY